MEVDPRLARVGCLPELRVHGQVSGRFTLRGDSRALLGSRKLSRPLVEQQARADLDVSDLERLRRHLDDTRCPSHAVDVVVNVDVDVNVDLDVNVNEFSHRLIFTSC